jgi:hypothetical protein
MMRSILLLCLSLPLAAAGIPEGFTPIFNGRDLSGWHISEVNHHGNTRAWTIVDGVLLVTQDQPGNGGILLTDRHYETSKSHSRSTRIGAATAASFSAPTSAVKPIRS